jgi:hypothetical protein
MQRLGSPLLREDRCMKRSDLTEDDRDEEAVLALLELLQKFGDPLKRPAKVIPWPKRPPRS